MDKSYEVINELKKREQRLMEKKKKGEIGIKDYLQGKKEIKAEKDKFVVEYGVKLSQKWEMKIKK